MANPSLLSAFLEPFLRLSRTRLSTLHSAEVAYPRPLARMTDGRADEG